MVLGLEEREPAGEILSEAGGRIEGARLDWRKRVRVERTIDIEDANRRF